MTQKTISLNEKSYNILKKMKKKGESYSDLIIRLCNICHPSKNDPLLEYAGIFNEDEEFWNKIADIVKDYREQHLTNEINEE
jgi:predicted CopG family antitoxin